MIAGIFSLRKAIDTLDDIEPTQTGVASGDPFALDDRMRVVFTEQFVDTVEENRDVGPSIRLRNVRAGSGFGTRQYGYLPSILDHILT